MRSFLNLLASLILLLNPLMAEEDLTPEPSNEVVKIPRSTTDDSDGR
ncbi:hypothetical protein DB43_HD00610, partial [Parachlamydia acanthamoebae]